MSSTYNTTKTIFTGRLKSQGDIFTLLKQGTFLLWLDIFFKFSCKNAEIQVYYCRRRNKYMKKIILATLFVFSLFSCAYVDPYEDLDVVLQKMNSATTARELLAVLTVGNLARVNTIDDDIIKAYMSLPKEDYYLDTLGQEKLFGKLWVADQVLFNRPPVEGFTSESNFALGEPSAFAEFVITTLVDVAFVESGRNRILRDINSAGSAGRIAEIFEYDDYHTGEFTSSTYDNINLAEIANFLRNTYTDLESHRPDSQIAVCKAVLNKKPYPPSRIGAEKLMTVFHEATAIEIVKWFNNATDATEMLPIFTGSTMETLEIPALQQTAYNALTYGQKMDFLDSIISRTFDAFPEDASGVVDFVAAFCDALYFFAP
ncbi:MAG: hypothetical protein Ta2A_19850 [Treponemataceae bacterium]|nr:MAG: hypothetical protein Ta2A_19850 [Treponemataceae bacterium]